MAFINRYTKGDSLNYFYSEEFIQNGDSFILAIGKTKAEGLITCTDTQGQLIWEKVYRIEKEEAPISFKKIIQIKPHKEFDYQYIIHATTGKKHYLISIDSKEGTVNWVESLPWKDEDVIVHLEASHKAFEFFVVISDRNQIDTSNSPFVAKFLGNGSFVTGNYIVVNKEEFIVEAIHSFKEGLVIAGRYIEKDSRGIIIELNNDLKLNKPIQIVTPYNAIHDIKWLEGKYLISGYLVKEQVVFVSILDSNLSSQPIFYLSNTRNNHSQLQIAKEGFYILTHYNTHGILHLLDWNFNVQWSKKIHFDDLENGLRQFNFNIETNRIVTTAYNQKNQSLLVCSEDQFITCKTQILKPYSVEGIKCDIKELDIDFKQEGIKPIQYKGDVQDISSNIIEYCPSIIADLKKSTITANPDCILPSGGQSAISVQLVDANGNAITNGANTVVINTSFANISTTTNNNNGTYTAVLTSASPGNATLSFTVNGQNAGQTVNVTISKNCDDIGNQVDLKNSTITAASDCIQPPNGQSVITVQLIDSNGNPITNGNSTVVISTSLGNINTTTNNNNGTYTAILTSTSVGIAILSFTVDGNNASQTVNVTVSQDCNDTGGEVDLNVSTITANPNQIQANGTSTSTITVHLLDSNGNPITTTLPVTIVFENGTSFQATLSTTNNQGGGVYTAILQSANNEQEQVELSFVVGTQEAFGNVALVNIFKRFIISPNGHLQSPSLYLQAAGSTGNDGSVSGVHLRWMLKGFIGNTHLPKGNHATTNNHFNKPDDFVRIYRAIYNPQYTILDFQELSPNIVDNNHYLWIYHLNGNPFYVYFKNAVKYNQVKATIDPLTSSYSFIQSYGSELIEVDHKTTLSFAVTLRGISASTAIQAETLSVENNSLTAIKYVTARKDFTEQGRFEEENIRAVRFKANHVKQLLFERYADALETNTDQNNWSFIGAYALTDADSIAENRLEATSGTADIHGQWPRFNDNETVNKDNYINRWNGTETQSYGTEYYEYYDRRLKTTIKRYIEITDEQPTNPTAIEAIPFSTTLPEGVETQDQDVQSISNLKILRLGSMDYHLARMMGLGHIDNSINTSQQEEKYFYLAEYVTLDNINNGQQDANAEEIQHLYLSLPTAMINERLPIPVNLSEPILGTNNPEGNSLTGLIDEEGYLFDGKQRFISLVIDDLLESQTNIDFYETNVQFSTSESTEPVYLGLEYKLFDPANPNASNWRKPELSNTSDFHNYIASGTPTVVNNETIPLLIPEAGETLFLHREREEGWHRYSSYSINWFGRSQMSTIFWDLETKFKPQNRLLPPSNAKACLIVEESPLMLTSADEQAMYNTLVQNNVADKTLIRLTFDHHIDQDRLTYQINQESMGSFTDPLHPDAIFKDDKEVFADRINLFFRNRPPKTVAGKIKSIEPHSNSALAIIRTEPYQLVSTGDEIVPEISNGQLSHFIGSVFMFNSIKYIIHEVVQSTISGEGPIFTVYKQIISEAMINGADPDSNMPLELPVFSGITMFNTVENMLTETNWQVGNSATVNKLDFQIQIEDEDWSIYRDAKIHREVIDEESISGVPEQIVEKSRGIWRTAFIEEELRPQAVFPEQYDIDGSIVTELIHNGMYKITFPNTLEHHPQFNTHNIDWYQGIIRIHTQNNPTRKRKILEVVKIENVGTTTPLIVYAIDPQYPVNVSDDDAVEGFDPILIGNQEVNFYPGYRVYLYHDVVHHLTEDAILPDTGEGLRYSIFGLQTIDPNHPEDAANSSEWYASKIGQPAPFFAQEIIRPQTPLMSNGEEFIYATRPDTFGKSTFTLTPGFLHTPHGVQFYRTNDDAILNALYKPSTLLEIKTKLKGDLDPKLHLVKRWQNLLEFDLEYDETFQTDGQFFLYPEDETGYRFPMPDKYYLYKSINDILEYRNQNYGTNHNLLDLGNPDDDSDNGVIGTLAFSHIVIPAVPSEGINDGVTLMDYMKSVIYNAFTPLTEIPLMHQYINDSNYQPIAKKQVIRDDNGLLLAPTDPKFDMAPMAKKLSNDSIQNIPGAETAVLFTDFNLDGTSDNLYFYAIREMGNTMQLGDYSTILGPIKLVNTKPPQAPEIRRIMPVLQNDNLGILTGVSVEINAYPKIQNIKQLKLYRTLNPAKALSVRSMDLIKTIDLEVDGQIDNNIWKIKDEFADLGYVPYSDPLYYKVTALREITYADGSNIVDATHPEITEYAPSEPSKLLISSIVETTSPESPTLQYNFDPDTSDTTLIHHVILKWEKKVHNGKYHVYKMNNQGNWIKIHTLSSNLQEIQLLAADTSLENGTLSIENDGGSPIYHHFKVISENSVGMLSTEDKIMTLPNENNIASEEGIGDMIIENTNIVR